MKVVSQLLLLVAIITVPFLSLAGAKNPDARFLKKPKAPKAPKAPKTPKAPAPALSKKSPKATQSPTSSPTSAPTSTPTTPQLTQIFYSNGSTSLEADVYAEDDEDDSKLVKYYLDLGHIKGHSSKTETIELLQTSFTTSIYFELDQDDDDTYADMEARVFLEIFAYAGCDSAAACEEAGVNPTPLIPEGVEMYGWFRYVDVNRSGGDDFHWEDIMTSTNEAQFLLADKGTAGDFFLKARFTLDLHVFADDDVQADIDVIVEDWVVVIWDGNKNFSATKAVDVYTDSTSPSISPTT